MSNVELLSPAGDFEALKAAVQNGADAVYFGANKFNARVNSTNFDKELIKQAINYAKLRNVKTHLTLNILIKNNEFEEAMELVDYVYKSGIDAIIVQDLGLATEIIKKYPDLEVHGSTQMTIYDINGVKQLEKLGFKRAVLARELSIKEIEEICKKSNIDIETFVHGALCISYSGQCLMSSIIGGRSGNRGKCAGTCRLPYELINKENKEIEEKGYLLSSKDVCTLDIIPELVKSGIKSFKIEGRMKSPEYVATVTRIYRKYIDLAESKKEYIVEDEDRKKLLQIFNRGGFSTGYIKGKLGKDMMYTKKPNHIGIYIGEVISYNPNKGYVKLKTEDSITLGDSIAIKDSSCKISELMIRKDNIKKVGKNEIVTIGRIKGKINPKDKIYKTVSIELTDETKKIANRENRKRQIICNAKMKVNENLSLEVEDIASGIKILAIGDKIEKANKTETTKERIEEQLTKTGNTVFEISKLNIDIDKGIFVSIKNINELRRKILNELENKILNTFQKNKNFQKSFYKFANVNEQQEKLEISILLNKLNHDYDYEKINNVDKVYIPVSEYIIKENEKIIKSIINKFETYVFFPSIIKTNYKRIVEENIDKIVKLGIKGFVISNLSQIELVKKYNLEIIANYTMNIFNNQTIDNLEKFNFSTVTISPELNKSEIMSLGGKLKKELIVYGRTLLMTSEYCLIGTFNKCTR